MLHNILITEHDNFSSIQTHEDDISRAEALKLVEINNTPKYRNIRWYLDALGMDFLEIIKVTNKIPKIHNDG